jgi:hypothetical protein
VVIPHPDTRNVLLPSGTESPTRMFGRHLDRRRLDVVLSQLLVVALELEELPKAGYVHEQPVEADGLRLSRVATAEELPR